MTLYSGLTCIRLCSVPRDYHMGQGELVVQNHKIGKNQH